MIKKQQQSSGGGGLIGLLFGGLVVGGLAWYFMTPSLSREQAIAILLQANPNRSSVDWTKFTDNGFLIAWAKGIQDNLATFNYNNAIYYTTSGNHKTS